MQMFPICLDSSLRSEKLVSEGNVGGEIKLRLRSGRFLPALILGLDSPLDDLIVASEERPKKRSGALLSGIRGIRLFCKSGEGCA